MSEHDKSAEQNPTTVADEVTPAIDEEPSSVDSAADVDSEVQETVRQPRRFAFASLLPLILAVLGLILVSSLWWQYRALFDSLAQTDSDIKTELESMRAGILRLDDQLLLLDGQLEASSSELLRTAGRLDTLPARFAELAQRIDAVQGGALDVQALWLFTEAEYYLTIANTELELAGHWENAIEALELADNRLRQLADPALGPVRELIADELIALRAVRQPDIEGTVFSLGRLAERIGELPSSADRPANFASPDPDLEEAEPGLGRLWLGLKGALAGIVSVERREEPVRAVLSAEEQQLTRRQLEVELQLARIAAIRGQPEVFRSSLSAARTLLEQNFDTTAPAVEGAIALLTELMPFDIAPARPDISGSLNRLRSLPSGDD